MSAPQRVVRVIPLVGLTAATVGLLTYATTPLGPGVETDAVNYLSAAASLARGAGYLGWDGQPLAWFPPGYPLVVSLGQLITGLGVQPVAQMLDLAFAAALVVATYLLACRVMTSRWLPLLATALVASSPIVLSVYALVSSETVFNFLCVVGLWLACLLVAGSLSPARRRAAVWLLTSVAALAVLTRLAGVALVMAIGISLLVGPGSRRQRAVESLQFMVLAMAPSILWTVWMHSQTGGWSFGNRPPSTVGIIPNLGTAVGTLAGWPAPLSTMLPGGGWLDLAAAAAVALALTVGLARAYQTPGRNNRQVAPVFIFCVVYPATMVAISSVTALVGALDDRYLSPMLAPLAVLLVSAVEIAWPRGEGAAGLGKGLAVALAGIVAISAASALVLSARAAQLDHAAGISGVTRADWSSMPLLRIARKLPRRKDVILLSNLPEMMSYSTGRMYQYPPFRGGGDPTGLQHQVSVHGPAYLAVLSAFDDPGLYTPDELGRWFSVRVLESSGDGELVELKSLPSQPST